METVSDSKNGEKVTSAGPITENFGMENGHIAVVGSQIPKRNLGPLEIISVGFNIANSWAGIASTLAFSVYQGGPVTIIYGMMMVFVVTIATGLSLSEIANKYPTAGGQYHWTSILGPKKGGRVISYICGCVNIFGWITNIAGVTLIPGEMMLAIASWYNPTYEVKPWHNFLIYQFFNFAFLLSNLFTVRRTPWMHDIGFIFSIASFLVIVIVCLSMSHPKQSSEFVWTAFVNESGWKSKGVVFLSGLVNPAYIYGGLDGALHLAEECSNAATAVPWALMATIMIGFVTGLWFAISMLYSTLDFDAAAASRTGLPIFEIWRQATNSPVAASFFTMMLCGAALFAINAVQQTSSRLTWSFARDDAIVFSKYIGHIHPKLGVPVWALVFDWFVILIVGCIYLGSTTAFNALVGTGLLLQQVSFAFPIALLMFQGRNSKFLPEAGIWRLGIWGWLMNAITVAWAIIVLVFFCFPLDLPVTGSNMNYSVVVLAVIAIFCVINWFVYARKHYFGPAIPLELMTSENPESEEKF